MKTPSKLKSKLIQLIILALCAFIIGRYFIHHQDELKSLSDINPKFLIILFCLNCIIQLLTCYKMLLLLRKLDLKSIKLLQWLNIFSISRFLNFHLTQGGNLYRSIKLKKEFNFSYTNSIGLITVFAWLEVIFILLIAIVLILFGQQTITELHHQTLYILMLTVVALFILPFAGRWILNRIHSRSSIISWFYQKLTTITDHFKDSCSDLNLITKIFLLSLVNFLLFASETLIAFKALGSHLSLFEVTLLTALTLLSGVIFITPGNLGITELSFGYLAELLGGTMGVGILACGILRIMWYITIVLFAAVFLKTFLKDKKELNLNEKIT